VAALYALRRNQPRRPRPYRAWGYPWVPAVYFVASGAVAWILLWGRPLECAIGLGLAVAGLPFYWLFSRRGAAARAGESE
jgi:APA family basic amino acid/polyamine antiporter